MNSGHGFMTMTQCDELASGQGSIGRRIAHARIRVQFAKASHVWLPCLRPHALHMRAFLRAASACRARPSEPPPPCARTVQPPRLEVRTCGAFVNGEKCGASPRGGGPPPQGTRCWATGGIWVCDFCIGFSTLRPQNSHLLFAFEPSSFSPGAWGGCGRPPGLPKKYRNT